jgi:hypothetical protein
MKNRSACGEAITEESWVMRNVWNTKKMYTKGLITIPKKLKSTGVKSLVDDALWTQAIRKKLEPGRKRHEFQSNHGFRKWFKTQCELAGMKWNYKFILQSNRKRPASRLFESYRLFDNTRRK